MEVLDTPAAMREWSRARHRDGRRVGFVPTMGALHAGHLSLVDIAARHADDVVVSIFVNPLQFDRPSDFDAYPRPIDEDVERCREAGVAAVYAPTARTMYPEGFETHVEPGGLAAVMEGAARPGHFRGVTTVVTKLFGAVRPDVAVFGEKDFQQLAIIRRMTTDLDLGVEIIGAPIVREPDGLAMSSRNVRLDPAQRAAAAASPGPWRQPPTPPPRAAPWPPWSPPRRAWWPPSRSPAWSTSRCSIPSRSACCTSSTARSSHASRSRSGSATSG
jgi:pantoate--beta-alanine ligase